MGQAHTHVDRADDACYRKSSVEFRSRSTPDLGLQVWTCVMEPTEPHRRGLVLGSGAAGAAAGPPESQARCIMMLGMSKEADVQGENVKPV